ncbi:LysR family transcriptional regulator [Poseidonocella sp. HB161398]|uniref:LysR family transcriptional regulator n=1 Tax=Poseidonocella sp. HB161398 TaxID=2320855 RepID=UPI001109ABA1|nr:LysR family transcriptional regulator [Poseidonocella sp. HB161398]
MDLRHLRHFMAPAERPHFARAAERLDIVQPTLSMQIRALKEDVGATFFARARRRVELTQAGAPSPPRRGAASPMPRRPPGSPGWRPRA